MSVTERIPLAKRIPLRAPMSVHFSVTNHCNYRCFYCQHGNDEYHKKMKGTMTLNQFKKAVDNITSLGLPKKLIFAGLGEPLLNQSLPDMIRYANEKGIYTDLLTNASLLSSDLSDRLIGSGLSEMRVSLQGLSSSQYFEVCQHHTDFDQLVSELRYFYEHKGKCKLNIKIVDSMLKNEGDKENYHRIFDGISDHATVESLIPTNNLVNTDSSGFTKTLKGERMIDRTVCPLPFYQMIVNYNGDIHCGCSNDNGTFNCPVIGNALTDDFQDIWNKGEHYSICLTILQNNRSKIPGCNHCNDYRYQGSNEDNLDDRTDEILLRMREITDAI